MSCIVKKISVILFSVILLITGKVYSQKFTIEPGITVGTSYYLGDINHTRQFYSPGLAVGAVIRHPVNDFYAFRLNLLRGKVSGNDADFKNNYQQVRSHNFTNTLYEVSIQAEINFLSFNAFVKKNQAPYLTVGTGMVYANSGMFSLIIPVGIGYKYSPIKKMTISAEWSFRNTFSDKLDMLEQPDLRQKQITKSKNNDWYSVAGVTVTYNLSSDKKWCPAYDKRKKH